MNDLLDSAMFYLNKLRWPVIPINPKDKKPLIPMWKMYQEEFPTHQQVVIWFKKWEDAMIGIVTGSISNLAVIDVDTEEGKEEIYSLLSPDFHCPLCYTPKGLHLYCQYPKDLRNRVRVLKGIDIRAEAGYVIAPPSKNFTGKQYVWDEKWRVPETPIPEFPREMLDSIDMNPRYNPIEIGLRHFQEGRRDDDLFRAANLMLRGGASKEEVLVYIKALAAQCVPPFPEREAERKVESAVQRAWRRDHSLVDEVKEYLEVTRGLFNVTEVTRALQLVTKEDRNNLRVILHRLVQDEKIERHPKRDGVFRKVIHESTPLDWINAPVETVDLWLPFDLHNVVSIYKKNVLVIAGEKDSGKTAMMLNLIAMNQNKWDVKYFTNEMGASELKLRLSKFEDVKDWKFKASERTSHFSDVISPNALNLIDYLDPGEAAYRIAGQLNDIFEKLVDGIAIVAIQKSKYKELGRGSDYGLQLARLYLTIGNNQIKIVSAKNWKSIKNPNGLVLDFKLRNGCAFTGSTWHEDYDEKPKRRF